MPCAAHVGVAWAVRNYMMLELLLTRSEDRELVRAALGVRFLVFDELHTYRGRQGADVALLFRRCRQAFGGHDIVRIGTSATMTSGGSTDDQKREVARIAQTLFGVPFEARQVIGETLQRATPKVDLTRVAVVEGLGRQSTPAPARISKIGPQMEPGVCLGDGKREGCDGAPREDAQVLWLRRCRAGPSVVWRCERPRPSPPGSRGDPTVELTRTSDWTALRDCPRLPRQPVFPGEGDLVEVVSLAEQQLLAVLG